MIWHLYMVHLCSFCLSKTVNQGKTSRVWEGKHTFCTEVAVPHGNLSFWMAACWIRGQIPCSHAVKLFWVTTCFHYWKCQLSCLWPHAQTEEWYCVDIGALVKGLLGESPHAWQNPGVENGLYGIARFHGPHSFLRPSPWTVWSQ